MNIWLKSILICVGLLVGARDVQANFGDWLSQKKKSFWGLFKSQSVSSDRTYCVVRPEVNPVTNVSAQLRRELDRERQEHGNQLAELAELAMAQQREKRVLEERSRFLHRCLVNIFQPSMPTAKVKEDKIYYPEFKEQNAIQLSKQGKLATAPWVRPTVAYEPRIYYREFEEQNAIKLDKQGKLVSRAPTVATLTAKPRKAWYE